MTTDPSGILAAATHLREVAESMLIIVPVAGLVVVGLWGWLTRGRGY